MAEQSAVRRVVTNRWFDRALAIGFSLITLTQLFADPHATHSAPAALLVVALCSTIVVRRRHPLAAVAVFAAGMLAAAAVHFEGNFPPDAGAPVMFILAYSCGAYAPLRSGLLAVVGLASAAQVDLGFSNFPNVEIGFLTIAPWWVGWEVGGRRRLVSALHERTRELEAAQEEFVRLSVRRERARIARELHDIVAHHLAVIVVQAGAGRLAGTENGTRPAERLETIRQSGDQALADMSRLVDIIHADTGPAHNGVERLRALVEDARAAGLDVELTAIQLPDDIEADALRIVQEGLTNAIKHAPGAHVAIRLAATDDALEIQVRDRGGGSPTGLAQTGAGLGLSGMRERIESLGGSLEAGPCPDGGWQVEAWLPIAARPLASAR
jgi:signal transduction histidine kinase